MCRYHSLYLVWINEFLSVEAFADYYGMHEDKAFAILNLGRMAHESQFGPII